MKRTRKGAVSGVLLAIIAVAAIALVALGFGIGLGIGGGNGDGEGSGDLSSESADASETAPPETTAPEITTAQMDYLIVTVSENDYLFQAQTYPSAKLETLIGDLAAARESENIPIKVSDDNASQRAYSNLKNALKEHGIPYIDGTAAE